MSRPLDRYLAWYEALTPDSVADVDRLFTADARFCDPFNDLRGRDEIRAMLEHMFATTSEVRFEVLCAAGTEALGLAEWRCTLRLRRVRPDHEWTIVGATRIAFAADGRVTEHVDHWDAATQVYAHLPLLGAALRLARRAFVVPGIEGRRGA
ncbi:MAG: nuclear transport factor 2 family protein [Ectothiorhodospiraceae bacterium]|nr:nuclear transport factor 2 family protein [Ectothiorhodospiraceae bacterium]